MGLTCQHAERMPSSGTGIRLRAPVVILVFTECHLSPYISLLFSFACVDGQLCFFVLSLLLSTESTWLCSGRSSIYALRTTISAMTMKCALGFCFETFATNCRTVAFTPTMYLDELSRGLKMSSFLFCFNHTVFTLTRVWQDLNDPLRLRARRLDGGASPLLPFVPTDKWNVK